MTRRARLICAAELVVAVAFLVSRYLVLIRGGTPPTVDAGNWLAFGHSLLGDASRPGVSYPPLVPGVVTAAVSGLGATHGVALVATLSGAAPAAAVFAIVRASRARWWAIPLAALVATTTSNGEITAWGGFPQLLASAFAVLLLWQFDRALRTPVGRGHVAVLTVLLAAVLATSHLIALVTAVAALLVFVLAVSSQRSRMFGRVRRLWLALVPCILFVPLYLNLATTVSATSGIPRPLVTVTTGPLGDLEFLYEGAPFIGRAVVFGALLAAAVLAVLRRSQLWRLGVAWGAASVLLARVVNEPRFLYCVFVAAALVLAALVELVTSEPSDLERPALVALAVTLVAAAVTQAVAGHDAFGEQRQRYGILRPGTVHAIDWIDAHATARDVVAVGPLDDAPLGWWVEGLTRNPTLYASQLAWLNFRSEQRRAKVANRIFVPRFPRAGGLRTACSYDVDFVLVDRGWGGFDEKALRSLAAATPRVVALRNRDAVVLDLTTFCR